MQNEQIASGDLRPPKLSHMVADRLRAQIISGQIKTGSTLPPENELLTIFKVSRPTLREALRILEAEAFISIGRGVRTGAVVLGASVGKMADYATVVLASEGVTMLDLHEARTLFEPAIVHALEGLSATVVEAAVKDLRAVVAELEAELQLKNYVGVVAGTQRFHGYLAGSSGNRTIALLVETLHMISDDVYASALLREDRSNSDAVHKNMTKTVAGYKALVDLLDKKKFEEAAAFWKRYMERSRDFLRSTQLGKRQIVHNGAAAG